MNTPDTTGIDAPETVAEGSTGSIEVSAGESSKLSVQNPRTGEEVEVEVDDDGKAQFELFSSAQAGDTLIVIDPDNVSLVTTIEITPASAI